MYPIQKTLAEEVKREVIAELQQGGYTNIPQTGAHSSAPANAPTHEFPGQQGGYLPHAADQTYQTIKDSVKNEVLAEIQTQQVDKMAQFYGLGRSLSDQKIQQMIDARYRTIDNLKADIKKELLALQETESQRSPDPYIRQIAGALVEEARRQGIPTAQLVRNLDQKTTAGGGIMNQISGMLNTGQRRGFLCGVGAMLLCHLLLPSTRKNMHSVAVRSMEEGLAMVDRAKSFVSGRQQQTPPSENFTNQTPGPPPPPEGNQPGEGG